MAFVLTYDTLTTAVIDYLERNDANVISQIPLFIMLAERRIARDLKILLLKVAVTDDLIVGQGVIAKPNRWLDDASFNIGVGDNNNERKYLLLRSVEWCRLFWPDPTKTGEPKYYANDYNYNFWFIVPTPVFAYPYESLYFETPQFIDETVSINPLTANAPEILIYATVLEANLYLKNKDLIADWQQKYDTALKSLGIEDIKRIEDHFSKRGG